MTGKLVSFLAALAVLLALARSCHCISHTVHPCSAAISLLSADAFAFLRRRACGSLS
jgi:hypothetical protein